MAVIHVARCDYNIYDKAYVVEVDIHRDLEQDPETLILKIPSADAATEAQFRASVEVCISRVDVHALHMHDWTGTSWRANL
jgi:hypothetical protein